MFASVQVPLADLRRFVPEPTGRLSAPPWPVPDPHRHFVRAFGPVRARRRGGVEEWLGEDFLCDARRAVKFASATGSICGAEGAVVLRPTMRRFFAGGQPPWTGAVARFDVGFQPFLHRTTEGRIRYAPSPPMDVAMSALTVPVAVPGFTAEPIELSAAGPAIAKSLLNATTSLVRRPSTTPSWWVAPGTPLVLVEGFRDVHPIQGRVPVAAHEVRQLERHGRRIPIWVVWFDQYVSRDSFRRLRIHLWRLHNEREVLRLVLAAIIEEKLDPSYPPLRDYLAKQADRLTRHKTEGFAQRYLLSYAYSLDQLVAAGDIGKLMLLLKAVSPGVASAVRPLAEGTCESHQPDGSKVLYHIEGTAIFVSEGGEVVTEGGQHIENTGTIGAVAGRDISNSNIVGAGTQTVTQAWSAYADSVDLTALQAELAALRAALRSRANAPEHDMAVAEVAQAEQAAAGGDKTTLGERLAKAGKWALDVAVEIGKPLASAALKAAMGL